MNTVGRGKTILANMRLGMNIHNERERHGIAAPEPARLTIRDVAQHVVDGGEVDRELNAALGVWAWGLLTISYENRDDRVWLIWKDRGGKQIHASLDFPNITPDVLRAALEASEA